MSGTTWTRIGAILGGLGVAFGAFGAHGLEGRLTARGSEIFETAVRYQIYHALALVAVGLLANPGRSGKSPTVAGWAFLAGILAFSGTLYAMALTGVRWPGRITPIGGVALIVGWSALAVASGSQAWTKPVED